MKKTFNISGMSCNSCANNIENELKDKVNSVKVSFSEDMAEIDYDEKKISEKEIIGAIERLGYESETNQSDDDGIKKVENLEDKNDHKKVPEAEKITKDKNSFNRIGWIILISSILLLLIVLYIYFKPNLPELQIPELGEKTSLILLFVAGLLTGFHCIAMCGGFVVSYTAKNAIKGHKSFKQHLVYGTSKVISYTIIGGIFGLIGGVIAFSLGLRGWIAILAGIFMIVYSLSMFGIGFFKKFRFNPKFLSKVASKKHSGAYTGPLITGLLNGLFIACGPLQAMYLYAAGTGNFVSGATSLAAFGLGTLPIMLGFGSLATVISHKTTGKILKISAVIVLILGLIMLNRGLTLTGSSLSLTAIKTSISGVSGGTPANLVNSVQEINMDVSASGYSPNSFVLKKGVPVKWNINVKQLTGCNSELVSNAYNINLRLKTGLQTFEFTPNKVGTFTFSCGMGMMRGSFIVTDDGKATQQQVQAATPKSSGSCNMGANGGGCGCGG